MNTTTTNKIGAETSAITKSTKSLSGEANALLFMTTQDGQLRWETAQLCPEDQIRYVRYRECGAGLSVFFRYEIDQEGKRVPSSLPHGWLASAHDAKADKEEASANYEALRERSYNGEDVEKELKIAERKWEEASKGCGIMQGDVWFYLVAKRIFLQLLAEAGEEVEGKLWDKKGVWGIDSYAVYSIAEACVFRKGRKFLLMMAEWVKRFISPIEHPTKTCGKHSEMRNGSLPCEPRKLRSVSKSQIVLAMRGARKLERLGVWPGWMRAKDITRCGHLSLATLKVVLVQSEIKTTKPDRSRRDPLTRTVVRLDWSRLAVYNNMTAEQQAIVQDHEKPIGCIDLDRMEDLVEDCQEKAEKAGRRRRERARFCEALDFDPEYGFTSMTKDQFLVRSEAQDAIAKLELAGVTVRNYSAERLVISLNDVDCCTDEMTAAIYELRDVYVAARDKNVEVQWDLVANIALWDRKTKPIRVSQLERSLAKMSRNADFTTEELRYNEASTSVHRLDMGLFAPLYEACQKMQMTRSTMEQVSKAHDSIAKGAEIEELLEVSYWGNDAFAEAVVKAIKESFHRIALNVLSYMEDYNYQREEAMDAGIPWGYRYAPKVKAYVESLVDKMLKSK
jgi:hypothetical protein